LAKRAKNPAQNVTEQDREFIDMALIAAGMKLYNVIVAYTPQAYARKYLLEATKKDLAATRLAYEAAERGTPDSWTAPGELNIKLAEWLSEKAREAGQAEETYLHSRDLRQDVLQVLEKKGIYMNLRQRIRRKRGKEKHIGSARKLASRGGGRPSHYRITVDMEKLHLASAKPVVQDYLHAKLRKSNLQYLYEKFMISALFHAIRLADDEEQAAELAKNLVKSTGGGTDATGEAGMQEFIQWLRGLDEKQVEALAAKEAKESAKRKKGAAYFLPSLLLLHS
jgi:hypothetical protein